MTIQDMKYGYRGEFMSYIFIVAGENKGHLDLNSSITIHIKK